jgi:hypothetical protein
MKKSKDDDNGIKKRSAYQIAKSLPVIPGKTIRVPVEVALAYMLINDLEFVGVPSGWLGEVRRRASSVVSPLDSGVRVIKKHELIES